jgi:hypothetical protein
LDDVTPVVDSATYLFAKQVIIDLGLNVSSGQTVTLDGSQSYDSGDDQSHSVGSLVSLDGWVVYQCGIVIDPIHLPGWQNKPCSVFKDETFVSYLYFKESGVYPHRCFSFYR